jgi:hypothetical protein
MLMIRPLPRTTFAAARMIAMTPVHLVARIRSRSQRSSVHSWIVDGFARLDPDGGVVDQDAQAGEPCRDLVDQLGSQGCDRLVGPESGRLDGPCSRVP